MALLHMSAAIRGGKGGAGEDKLIACLHLKEAEKCLCRVLSCDPENGCALMVVAELLWHPLLMNRPLDAEAVYRYRRVVDASLLLPPHALIASSCSHEAPPDIFLL